jgi:hypothetical protein
VTFPARDPSPCEDVRSLLTMGVSASGLFCHPGRTTLTVRSGEHHAVHPEDSASRRVPTELRREEEEAVLLLRMGRVPQGWGKAGGTRRRRRLFLLLHVPSSTATWLYNRATSQPSDSKDRILSQPPEGSASS